MVNKEYERFIKLYGIDGNELLEKAFSTAEKAHEGQLRHSGEPFFMHPVAVASILAELGMDNNTVIAGLLHDVLEDTPVSYDQIKNDFSPEVALLVDGVTKLKDLDFKSHEEQQAESLRKMFLAMAADIRVVIIKLADRLHNMRTLKYQSENKKIEKAKETLEIYAPLAHRLGINTIKWELEDLSLKFLDPDRYFELAHKIENSRAAREENIRIIITKIREKVLDMNIKVQIEGRPKHIYSIHKKMINKNKVFEEVYDLVGIRIIVNSIKDCYAVLGLVHTMWKPLPMRFKDYIAVPKPNMYQSLHTTLLGDDGKPFEIQIRTYEMHKTAEYGIAAHWKYKEKNSTTDVEMNSRLAWLRELMDWQNDVKDSREFMETLKIDLFSDEVFVFTPKGEVHDFPQGATPLDFAYSIHSDVGHHCVGARINGKMVSLDYVLKTGDIVEIITSNTSKGPSHDWLNIVKTNQARSKIKQWIKKEYKDENIQTGKDMLEKEAKRLGFSFSDLLNDSVLESIFRRYSIKTVQDMYAAIGYGGISTKQILTRLIQNHKDISSFSDTNTVVVKKYSNSCSEEKSIINVKDQGGLVVRLAKCCNPVFGDDIVGYITRGKGVSVHRKDCKSFHISQNEQDRIVSVEWAEHSDTSFNIEIQIIADNRQGLIADVSKQLFKMNQDIAGLNATLLKDTNEAFITVRLSVSSVDDLHNLLSKIVGIKGVKDARRAG